MHSQIFRQHSKELLMQIEVQSEEKAFLDALNALSSLVFAFQI